MSIGDTYILYVNYLFFFSENLLQMKVDTKRAPSCILPWFVVPLDYLDSIGVFLRPVYNHYMFREFPYVNSRDYVVRAKSTPD